MKDHNIHREVKEKSMRHMPEHMAKHRKTGGRAEYGDGAENDEPDAEDVYEGKDSNVAKEAHGEVRKRGGKVKAKKVMRKHGGKAEEKKHLGKIEGEAAKRRLDRPGRKRGGGVGADVTPLSTANRTDDRRGPSQSDDERGITGEE
jgi:hypothetical protein